MRIPIFAPAKQRKPGRHRLAEPGRHRADPAHPKGGKHRAPKESVGPWNKSSSYKGRHRDTDPPPPGRRVSVGAHKAPRGPGQRQTPADDRRPSFASWFFGAR